MRLLARASGIALMAGVLSAGSAAAADPPAPELPLAGSTTGPIYLEDYRGLITVLCFFDDDCS